MERGSGIGKREKGDMMKEIGKRNGKNDGRGRLEKG
jgi:hypothetical protein